MIRNITICKHQALKVIDLNQMVLSRYIISLDIVRFVLQY